MATCSFERSTVVEKPESIKKLFSIMHSDNASEHVYVKPYSELDNVEGVKKLINLLRR